MSAKKNYMYNSLYTILNMILPLVTAPYLARVIGAEGVGEYAWGFSLAQFFVLVARLGLVNYGTREVASVRNDKKKLSQLFVDLFALKCIVSLVVSLVYLLYVMLLSGSHKSIVAVFVVWVISAFMDIDWFWFGLEQFKKVTIKNIVIKLITVIAIFVFVKDKSDVWLYGLIISLGYAIGYGAVWTDIKKYITFTGVDFNKVKKHILPCIMLLVPVLALDLYRSMDRVMLGYLSTMEETGYYDNGEKLIYCMAALISSLGTVMLPKISTLVKQNKEQEVQKYIGMSLKFQMALTSVMTFGLMAVSDSIVLVLFGAEFKKSALILFLTAPKLLFMGWSNVIRTQYIIPHKMDSLYIRSVLFGSIINLVLNFMLIPTLDSVGAVIGTTAAEIFVPVYQYIKLRKILNYKGFFKMCAGYVAIGMFMFVGAKAVQLVMGASFATLCVQVVVGAILFIVPVALYVKHFDKDINSMLCSLFNRKNEGKNENT